MIQQTFRGLGAQSFLLSLTPSSLPTLPNHTSTLSVLLNDSGGIVDDTIITKHSPTDFYVVTNAGRAKEDKEYFQEKLDRWEGEEVSWKIMEGWGLVALQGPGAAGVLAKMADIDLEGLKFGQSGFADVGKGKVRCHIARGGYTGEDGFEVSPLKIIVYS
jgi:aminomethyltransferase